MPQTAPGFDRLTVEADKLGGQACVRGYRFSAEQLLAAGWTLERIQTDFPFIDQNLPRIEQIITEHGNSRRAAAVISG